MSQELYEGTNYELGIDTDYSNVVHFAVMDDEGKNLTASISAKDVLAIVGQLSLWLQNRATFEQEYK